MIDKEYQVVGVVVLSVLLLGLFGCDSSTPTPALPVVDSFAVSVVTSEQWFFTDEHYITLKYLGEGELRNVEMTVTITASSADVCTLTQYKGSWSTNEEIETGVGIDQSIERVEIQGFGYRDGERVRIVHSGLIVSNKTIDEIYEDL